MLLRRGSRGYEVAAVQSMLNQVAPPGAIKLVTDGIFGSNTDRRVREFQQRSGLKVDGLYGPNTDAKLMAASKAGYAAGAPKPVSPPPAAAKPTDAAAPKQPSQMSEEELDALIRANVKDYEALRKGMGAHFDTFRKHAGRQLDTIKFANACGALEALIGGHAAAMVGGAAGMLGGVFLAIGSLIAWARAMEAGERTYGYRGSAYAATAWFFGKPVLTKSAEMRSRIAQFKFEEDLKAYDEAWAKATRETIQSLNMKQYDGASREDVKRAVQLAYGNDATEFCRDMLRGFTPHVGPQQEAVWKSNVQTAYPR